MILDNADDASVFFSQRGAEVHQMGDQMPHTTALSAYLPRTSMGLILVTSRNRDAGFRLVGREDRIINVERMGDADSISLLRKKLPNDQSTEDEWKRLVTALECLPLAITQAAAYIAVKAPSMTISKYLGYFHRNEKDQVSLLSKDGGDLRRDPKVPNAVVITWQISFDQIKKQNGRAADLLSRMCLLDRQGIPRFLFCQDDDGDGLDFEDAIGTLIAFSFVVAEKDGNIFQMHPLVQLSTKKWLEVHGEMEKSKEAVLSLLSEKLPNGEHANWEICEALDPHTGTVLGYRYIPQRCRLERAEILHNSAWYAWARGNYGVAGDRIREAIDAREELLGRDDPKTLSSLGLLASLLNDQGRWKEAEALKVQVMEIRKRVLGQEHPDTLTSMGNLASTYRNQGRWKEAEELDVQVMEIRRRVLGQEHPDTLTSMANLAHTWKSQGRDKEAIDLMKQAERLQSDILGSGHPRTIGSTQILHKWQTPQEAAESVSSSRGSL
jgi:tetratricopeptide (TPR) repeat protein